MEFDFNSLLSPYDFELLCKDVLFYLHNKKFKSYSEGIDGGIDLRFRNEKEYVIAQCKRTKNLSKKEINSEFNKIKNLGISRYILILAFNITPQLTDYILNIFSDFIKDEDDIISKNSLTEILNTNKDLLRKNYKLWINSSNIFDFYINKDIYNRSRSYIDMIKNDLQIYVDSPGLSKGMSLIKQHSILIISGQPGIGKSTLSNIIAWAYFNKNYEVYLIRSISECEKILDEFNDTKQLIVFDDFLGENFLMYDVFHGRSNDLNLLIGRINKSKNKILVMNTREYILNQAKIKYEKLNSRALEVSKYLLDLSVYSSGIKALILYNHLYYSNIDIEYIKDLLIDQNYKNIIEHENYSPRIIRLLTYELGKNCEPSRYYQHIIETLNNPIIIWDKAFENQISENAKLFLLFLTTHNYRVFLKSIFEDFRLFSNINRMHVTSMIKELIGVFIKVESTSKEFKIIAFHNPSIKDFMLNKVIFFDDELSVLARKSNKINQLLNIYKISESKNIRALIINNLCKNFDTLDTSDIIQWTHTKNSWHIYRKSTIGMLYSIINVIDDKKINNLIKKIVFSEKIDTDDFDFVSYYAGILKKNVTNNEEEITELSIAIFNEIYATEQIYEFIDFKEILGESKFDKVFMGERVDFIEEIKSIIEDDILNIRDREDAENIDIYLDDISNAFSIDLSKSKTDLEYEFQRVDEKSEEENYYNNETSQSVRPFNTDNNQIENDYSSLFKIEMFKR